MRSLNNNPDVYEGVDLIGNKLLVWMFTSLESAGYEEPSVIGKHLLGGIPCWSGLSRVVE